MLRCFAIGSALLILSALLLGCSGTDPAPKTELTDAEKQQIQQLNQQRVDEWGNKAK